MSLPLRLFEGFGIELEYMVVDKDSMSVKPVTDELLKSYAGAYISDWEDGAITWSNELVTHVVELKTTGPAPSLDGLDREFHRSILKIDDSLAQWNARLLPTAMHPWMDPLKETRLWPHDNNEIYAAYDRIFSCRGHGWSNLQSMHINLPFSNDDEFGRLHAAVRCLLPILPALSASSPVIEGRVTEVMDSRLVQYQQNQKRVPSIAGQVIPEPAFTKAQYQEMVLNRIYADIAPHDPDEILRDDWLNSRGAIARWERQTIEIRVLDTQECPAADLAIAALIVETLKALVNDEFAPQESLQRLDTVQLKKCFDVVVLDAERARISDPALCEILAGQTEPMEARDIWASILDRLKYRPQSTSAFQRAVPLLTRLLKRGCLSRAIMNELGANPSRNRLNEVWMRLADCLRENCLFESAR